VIGLCLFSCFLWNGIPKYADPPIGRNAGREMARKKFSEDTIRKCLLWSARHCCLCGKDCGVDIEVAHILGEEKSDDIDSAIPLCYDCHAKIGRYTHAHPRGRRYRKDELKPRRDQVYEQYTRSLVPSVLPKIHQDAPRQLPSVGFLLTNSGSFPSVKAKIKLTVFLGSGKVCDVDDKHGYYSGETLWHLNPMESIFGNFTIPAECASSQETLRIQIDMTAIDAYERAHEFLPCCYTYVRENNSWFLEPTSFENLKRRAEQRGHVL
jgi:hypothetical protein